MKITRQSILTFKLHTFDMPITEDEWKRFQKGESVQSVWGHLSNEKREFLLNGITPRESADLMGEPLSEDTPSIDGQWL